MSIMEKFANNQTVSAATAVTTSAAGLSGMLGVLNSWLHIAASAAGIVLSVVLIRYNIAATRKLKQEERDKQFKRFSDD